MKETLDDKDEESRKVWFVEMERQFGEVAALFEGLPQKRRQMRTITNRLEEFNLLKEQVAILKQKFGKTAAHLYAEQLEKGRDSSRDNGPLRQRNNEDRCKRLSRPTNSSAMRSGKGLPKPAPLSSTPTAQRRVVPAFRNANKTQKYSRQVPTKPAARS